MARISKEEKAVTHQIERLMAQHAHGVQINIFDLSKIEQAGKEAWRAGGSVEEAVKAAIQQYRQN